MEFTKQALANMTAGILRVGLCWHIFSLEAYAALSSSRFDHVLPPGACTSTGHAFVAQTSLTCSVLISLCGYPADPERRADGAVPCGRLPVVAGHAGHRNMCCSRGRRGRRCRSAADAFQPLGAQLVLDAVAAAEAAAHRTYGAGADHSKTSDRAT